MNLHPLGQIVAVIWIAISLWMAWVNIFILSILLMGVRQQSRRPLSVRHEAGIVLFFLISATVAGTLAFDSTRNIPRNVAHVIVLFAIYVLSLLAWRLVSVRRSS